MNTNRQTLIVDTNPVEFERRVNEHLVNGWKVVEDTLSHRISSCPLARWQIVKEVEYGATEFHSYMVLLTL